MRNRLIYLLFSVIFLILPNASILSQVTILGNNKGWLPINSSNGGVIANVIDVQLHMSGNALYNYPNWSIVARVTSPIKNNDNKVFPVEKMKLRFRNFRKVQYFETINPTINKLGVIQSDIPMQYSQQFLIQNSPLDITVPIGQYGSIVLEYDVVIEAGNYLTALKSWNNYQIQYEVTLLDQSGRVIGKSNFPIEMQIYPDGNYPEIPSITIEMAANAQNAELVFATANNYINGVSKTYENALSVNSNTGYEVTIKALDDKLKSYNGDLTIDLVSVQLKDPINNSLFNKENIQTYPKRIATGTATTDSKKYSIIYSATPNSILSNSKSGNYSVSILYSVSPL